jgi:phage host-nuclease inhibitor protein Gam
VLASSLLRRQAMTIAASAQPSASRDAEIQFIVARYAPQLEMHRRWGAELERAVQALAEQTKHESGYVGKKKSRDVGAGTYGYKTYAEGVELQDEATFIAWAEQQAPETLRVTIKLPLKDAREFRTEDELADCKREVIKKDATNLAESLADTLPPGFVKVAASDEFYAKPLPAAAISGARI